MTRISQAVLFFLLNATWQVTLIVLLASVGDRVLREAWARYRHTLRVAALAACVALPLGSLVRNSPAHAPASVPLSADQDRHRLRVPESKLAIDDALPRAPSGFNRMMVLAEMPTVKINRPLALAIVALYALLLLYRAQGLFRAWARTRTLVRSAQPIQLTRLAAEALGLCRRSLNLQRVKILSSSAVAVPVTAGTVRPVLILPEPLLAESEIHVLISALGHEAAHIVRRDYLMNLVYELVSLPLWFHPAMGLLLRRVRQTRELLCDELVTERLLEPRIYAQSLVQLAGAALPGGRPAATITVGIADANILEERIMSILKYSLTTPRQRRMWSTLAALLLVAPCFAAGVFRVHVAIRQPLTAVANDPLAGASVPAQQSDSGQQPSRPSATATATDKHLKTPTSIPDGLRRSETVIVVAQRPDDQKPKDQTLLQDEARPSRLVEDPAPPSSGAAGGVGGGVKGDIAGRVRDGSTDGPAGGIAGGVEGGVRTPPRRPLPSQTAKPERGSSDITEGNLIQLIEPVYPEEARAAGIQGDVVFEATIGKTGDLEKLRAISGHPILLAAAKDAVKQWKYEPYHLNAEPVEMETTITFKFRLEPRNP